VVTVLLEPGGGVVMKGLFVAIGAAETVAKGATKGEGAAANVGETGVVMKGLLGAKGTATAVVEANGFTVVKSIVVGGGDLGETGS